MTINEIKNNSTWIQGIGACIGKPASDLKVGDVLGWNGGNISVVTAIRSSTKTTITIEEEWEGFGGQMKRGERRLKKSRIVAMVFDGKFQVVNVTKSELSIA